MIVDDLEQLRVIEADLPYLVHILNNCVSLIPQGIGQMLVDIHGHIYFLMPQPQLYILQRCAILHQHSSVGMP